MKQRICSVDGCERAGRITKGMCGMHYARHLRHGDPGQAVPQHSVSNAGKVCEIAECGKPVFSTALCSSHYKRKRRYGDPRKSHRARTFEECFREFAVKGSGCWEWSGPKYANGYSKLTSGRKQKLGHRWSYEHHIGEIPKDLVIDHLCRNRGCVNPDHLEAVTNEENLMRGAGYALRNGMRTACINGHEYTSENTYVHPRTKEIRCRTCAAIRDKKRK